MKNFNLLKRKFLYFLFCMIAFSCITASAQKVDVNIEKIKEKCKDKPYEERVRVVVGRFNVTTNVTTREFGDNLATMLKNALHETNCFRVLESTKNMGDLTDEIALGQEGYTQTNSSPQSGKMIGAQVILTGEITEFSEGGNSAGALGVKVTKNKARVGFIITALNPETRDIYFTKSIESEGSKPGGFSGVKILGVEIAGGTKSNTAIADAVERGIVKAVYEISEEMDKIPFPKASSGIAEKKIWNTSNCPALASNNAPSIMVIVPENYDKQNYSNSTFSDLAVETSMIRQLTEAGFTVIDPAMYAAQRKNSKFDEAFKNPMAAAALGSEFGAEVVIVGDANSMIVSRGNMVSSRARVDTKAIRTSNGSIVATNGFDAGATDVSDANASKKALSNAGELMADYIIERLCMAGGSLNNSSSGMGLSATTIQINNTNIMKIKSLTDLLQTSSKVKEVKRTSFKDNQGNIEVKHEGVTDEIVDFLLTKATNLCEITGIENNKLTITMK